MNKNRLTRLEDQAQRQDQVPAPCPVAWDVDGVYIRNQRIADYDRWPGYILDLLKTGWLRWGRINHLSDRVECNAGDSWELAGWTSPRHAEMLAASVTLNMVAGWWREDGHDLPEDNAGMIEILEGVISEQEQT